MKNTITKLLIIPLALALLAPAWSQDGLEGTLKEMLEQNAEGYLMPLATAFGTGMNSGVFHQAKPHNILGFDFTLNLSVTTIPETDLEYEFFISDNPVGLPPFEYLGGVEIPLSLKLSDIYQTGVMVPTFFGDTTSVSIPVNAVAARNSLINQIATATGQTETVVEALVGTEITSFVTDSIPDLPGPFGIGIPAWPTVMPQIAIGLPFNTEVMLRGFSLETPDGDAITFGGFGAKISLSQFIPLFPVAISAGWYGTNLNLADIVTSTNSILSLQASVSVPIITLYGGIGVENSNISVFLEDNGTTLLDFDLEGKNKTRTTVGLRFNLLLFSINADYNKGEYDSYTIGAGLTLR